MSDNKFTKTDLLLKCKELGITVCKSKTRAELLNILSKQSQTEHHIIKNEIHPVGENHRINITENVSYYNQDILEFTTPVQYDLIYLDPPYDTNRTFTVNSLDDETGFTDVWEDDNKYREWLNRLIVHLVPMLSLVGTLVFHICSENSFLAEGVLRTHFKKIQKIYWKRCHGKNIVKNKLGEMMDTLFACSNNNNSIFNTTYIPIDENSVWAFKNKDDVGMYK